MFNRKCKITYIAHGSTIFTENHKLSSGSKYPSINKNGEEQMYKIVEFIKNRGVKNDKIISGPSLCTIQSSEIIAEELKKEFVIDENLSPRNYGEWEGMTFEQIRKKYPDFLDNGPLQILLNTPDKGESLTEFNNRINVAINNLIEDNLEKRLIVVTHPVIIRAAICQALNIPLKHQYNIYVKTGSANQISYFKNGSVLKYSNYVPFI